MFDRDSQQRPAVLALANGQVFHGVALGALGTAVGELVFNTAMTGYQEILTDPSYARQMITFTYPHIGNTGANAADEESTAIHASAVIIRNLPLVASSWRSREDLDAYLCRRQLPGIAAIDTRHLTWILRQEGAQSACLMSGEWPDETQALHQARQFAGLKGMDLARTVTTASPYEWTEGCWQLDRDAAAVKGAGGAAANHHVVAYDYGVKRNILGMLVARGCRVTVVPAQTPVEEILSLRPDGVFLSNGPGDPEACDYAVAAIQALLAADMPLFGICLGHQLLALASGARTVKMKFGHHGANHPVQQLDTGKVMITSQNHGFAVDEDSLPATLRATHRSLFDGSLQGIQHTEKPAFGFQGHPEASPGPHDAAPLFDHFIGLMQQQQESGEDLRNGG